MYCHIKKETRTCKCHSNKQKRGSKRKKTAGARGQFVTQSAGRHSSSRSGWSSRRRRRCNQAYRQVWQVCSSVRVTTTTTAGGRKLAWRLPPLLYPKPPHKALWFKHEGGGGDYEQPPACDTCRGGGKLRCYLSGLNFPCTAPLHTWWCRDLTKLAHYC